MIYDACFRWTAANKKSLDWGIKDNNLYNETFTGRVKSIAQCSIYLSELQPAMECPKTNHLHPPVREGTVVHLGWMTQSVSCIIIGMGTSAPLLHANIATTVRNAAAGIKSPNAQSKSSHTQHGNKDHEGGTDSVYY